MIDVLRRNAFGLAKALIYGDWPRRGRLDDGYTMLLPIPADMPFLLRFALLGLRRLRMPHCRAILVIPDGSRPDRELRGIVAESDDPRVRFVPLQPIDRLLVSLPRSEGSANYRHFSQILRGVLAATTDAIYLHDADAFWLEEGGVESQYDEFRARGLDTLGVTGRIDKMFKERGFEIPGTWELMFSSEWARRRPPAQMKGGWYPLPEGEWRWFDTLLHSQFVDYSSGKIGIMANPPNFVHFYGTIVEYRRWQCAAGKQPTEDVLFCLLLLSTLADVLPGGSGELPLPRPRELARGLHDPSAPITYLADTAPRKYASFRGNIEALCTGPIFDYEVAGKIRAAIAPFDDHFRTA